MVTAQPHFLLFCDTHLHGDRHNSIGSSMHARGRWHFVLERLDADAESWPGNSDRSDSKSSASKRLEATDGESAANRERLALLSVVRGLEALEQPSKVTLVTTSKYVSRGLRYGLGTWRESEYKWERFGVQMPIRNADLWQRIDGALQFHGVTCRLIQSQQNVENHVAKIETESTDRMEPHLQPTNSPAVEAFSAETHKSEPQIAWGSTKQGLGALSEKESFARVKNVPRMESSRRQPAKQTDPIVWQATWWKLAAAWIKWWRGRHQTRPAFSGS